MNEDRKLEDGFLAGALTAAAARAASRDML
jgi:hypothetical protein